MLKVDSPAIRLSDFRLSEDEIALCTEVLRSGRLSESQMVEQFEETWACYIGTRYCVAFSSGSAALLAGLLAARNLGLLQSDTILTNPNTYIATVNCIVLAGYRPVFVDIEPQSFGTMAVYEVRQLLNNEDQACRIAAVMPVHLFGFPERVPELIQLAMRSRKQLIEDAAQAHGSAILGRKLGSWGHFGISSFNMGHIFQAGQMGAVTTSSIELAKQLRSIKDQGRSIKDHRPTMNHFTSRWIGSNFKTSEINAVIALTQVKKAEEIITIRQRNARILSELLNKWSDILYLPDFQNGVCPFAYPILIRKESPLSRDAICKSVESMGVQARPMFPCIPLEQPSFVKLRERYLNRLPNSSNLGRRAFFVGCHEYLSEPKVAEIAQVIDRVLEASASRKNKS